uniref:Uncharacterized protein n=1 Tax=Lotharella oceanica TaxID=641309 RepID=A0A7S2TS96_9EUKA|mmetsp:Transcript_27735/g.51754  ORF Transcript_27735/g.51754 Transcript_27735/m.51754 type:complete len:165 (+) Transcript_27735:56-550(+)
MLRLTYFAATEINSCASSRFPQYVLLLRPPFFLRISDSKSQSAVFNNAHNPQGQTRSRVKESSSRKRNTHHLPSPMTKTTSTSMLVMMITAALLSGVNGQLHLQKLAPEFAGDDDTGARCLDGTLPGAVAQHACARHNVDLARWNQHGVRNKLIHSAPAFKKMI